VQASQKQCPADKAQTKGRNFISSQSSSLAFFIFFFFFPFRFFAASLQAPELVGALANPLGREAGGSGASIGPHWAREWRPLARNKNENENERRRDQLEELLTRR